MSVMRKGQIVLNLQKAYGRFYFTGTLSSFDSEAWEDWEQEVDRQNGESSDGKEDSWLNSNSGTNQWNSWEALDEESNFNFEGQKLLQRVDRLLDDYPPNFSV